MHAARAMFRLRGGLFKHTSSVAGVALAAVAASASLSPDAKAETAIVAHHHSPTSSHWSTPWRSVTTQTPQSSSTLALCKDMRQLYSVDSVIGRGGFGQVHEGRHKVSDAKVAIKRVCKQTTSKAKFLQEVDILRAVGGRHNVVELCEAFETADAYVLVTELVVGEELFDHLVTKGVLDAPRAQALVREIAQSLVYLHTHGVVHGDLKPENILLTAEANAIRLIDFGQSFREHNSSERSRCMGSGVATIAYAAPEVIASATSKTTATTTTVDSAIDMWGLGVVLYIVLCGYHPFDPENSASDNELADRIVSGKYDTSSAEWEALPSAAQDLIRRLLQVDPSQRISADDVLAHEWLATTKA